VSILTVDSLPLKFTKWIHFPWIQFYRKHLVSTPSTPKFICAFVMKESCRWINGINIIFPWGNFCWYLSFYINKVSQQSPWSHFISSLVRCYPGCQTQVPVSVMSLLRPARKTSWGNAKPVNICLFQNLDWKADWLLTTSQGFSNLTDTVIGF